MKKFSILYFYFGSLLCTFVGIKFLSEYSIKNIDQIDYIMISAMKNLTSGSSYSFILIAAIIFTIIGIIFSTIALLDILNSFQDSLSVLEKTTKSIIFIFFALNILISFYLLLFMFFLLFILIFIFFGIITFTTGNLRKGGPIHVRGHFRKGSYVKGHTRKRPRR